MSQGADVYQRTKFEACILYRCRDILSGKYSDVKSGLGVTQDDWK